MKYPAIVVTLWACVIILVLTRPKEMNAIMHSNEQSTGLEKVRQAIAKLWSADDTIRTLGRHEVVKAGPAAAHDLVILLSELIRNRSPRFAAEKEEVGAEALRKCLDMLCSGKQPREDDVNFHAVSSLAINQRLISDAISLLGELKSEEGVPILIRIMERHDTMVSEPTGIELEALTKIGAPAVPSLIGSIESASVTAAAIIDQKAITFGYAISCNSDDLVEDTEDEEARARDRQSAPDAVERSAINMKAMSIKQKALQVLGDIGDKSALPFLENLAKRESTEKSTNVHSSILVAIRKMTNDPSLKGPFPIRH
jgi:hypothetical protein